MAKANKDAASGQGDLSTDAGTNQSQDAANGASDIDGEIEQDGSVSPTERTVVPAPLVSGLIRALVLRDCGYGTAGAVVSLEPTEVATGAEQGALDPNEAAVAAAGG